MRRVVESIQVDGIRIRGKMGRNPSAALAVSPGKARTYYKRGNASYKEGHYDRAIANFTKAIDMNLRDGRAYNNRGSAYVGKGEYDVAISDFTRAIEINPGYARAYHNRGVAYACKGQYEMAALDNRRALELDPRYAESRDTLRRFFPDSDAHHNRTLTESTKGQDSRTPHPAIGDNKGDGEVLAEQMGQESVTQSDVTAAPGKEKPVRSSGERSGELTDRTGKESDRSSSGGMHGGQTKSAAVPTMDSLTPVHHYTLIFSLLVLLALALGWQAREAEYIVPDEGTGYNLGIIGGAMMLLLLLYPLRKKARFMRNWLAVKYWFWAHMVFGIIGPVLILFHSNFHLGSTNSRVALITTLVVAGSGIIGRYIYTRIHYGLYGREMTLKELQNDISTSRSSMVFELDYAPKLKERLLSFEAQTLKPHHGLLHSIWFIISTGIRARWTHMALRIALRRVLKVTARRAGWSAEETERHRLASRNLIAAYMKTVIRTSYFGFYEKLFALWHLFHFPCFLLLIIVAVVHVLAVHMY